MKLLLLIAVLFCLISCSKKNGDPARVDVLAAGWGKIKIPSAPGLTDIFFINNTTGFVIGDKFIYRSTDGGNNWQKVYQALHRLENIAMGSTGNAIFVCHISSGGKLITTFDGGMVELHFTDMNHGWACADEGTILKYEK